MNTKSIAMLLVASCFTSSVFATSFIDKLITKQSPTTSKTHQTSNQINHAYTNFSGTWLVDCGNGPMASTVIKNDAYIISLDGNQFRIGQGIQGLTQANEEYTSYDHSSFEWNSDGSALIMKHVGVSKDIEANTYMETMMDKIVLTMKNGQINLDGKYAVLVDVEQIEPTTIHCVFSKKQ